MEITAAAKSMQMLHEKVKLFDFMELPEIMLTNK